jgi:hypothetical protein
MTQYFVDALDGDDNGDGLSERGAWRSPWVVNRTNLAPGDSVLFRRGCTWYRNTPALSADWIGTEAQPIIIGTYGAGPRPVIQLEAENEPEKMIGFEVEGAYLRFVGLRVTLVNPYRNPAYPVTLGGPGARWGWLVGASISGHHVTLDDCEFDNLALGVNLTDDSHDNTITRCHFHDLNAMWAINGAPFIMGAVAARLGGWRNVIEHCRMERNWVEWTKPDGTVVSYSGAV